MTSADWTPVFVLPNIPLDTAIGCEIAALAPANDRRGAALKRAHPTLRRFLNRFADNFGQKFEPSVLILDATAPPIFRDLTAYVIHRMLTEGAVRASDKRAQFIGFGPYVAASGTMLRDLFQGTMAAGCRTFDSSTKWWPTSSRRNPTPLSPKAGSGSESRPTSLTATPRVDPILLGDVMNRSSHAQMLLRARNSRLPVDG